MLTENGGTVLGVLCVCVFCGLALFDVIPIESLHKSTGTLAN